MYKSQRNYENAQRAIYNGTGEYQIPEIEPTQYEGCDWIGFNYASTSKDREKEGVHFFLDDYQFIRLWTDPDRYVGMLQQFSYVMSPDFSMYTDFPKALQIYNHYRKHWLAAYWQEHGIRVIPTICWRGYTYCYANTTAKAKTAAAAFVRVGKGMVDKLWLDLEDKVMMGLGSRIVDIIKIYQTAAQSAGMGVGIYTGTSFYTSYLKPYIKQLAGIEFWFARYPKTKVYGALESAPGEPGKYLPAGVPIAGWQFTSCGQVPGINGRVDLSDWYYTESQTSTADIPVDKCPHKEPTITIKLGSTGEGANWVLWYLWRFGMMLDANGKPDGARINGYIGQADETAIKQAQTVLGLKADGKVGPATRVAFKKVL